MTKRNWNTSVQAVALIVSLTVCHSLIADDSKPKTGDSELSQYYGFKPLEVFKLERRSQNLLAHDMNQDGLTDLILIDNSHSRLDLLRQRGKNDADEKEPRKTLAVNEIENDSRFKHEKISVDRQVVSLAVGDFNSDGRADIAYFGVPDRLVIRLQSEQGDWNSKTSFRVPEVPPTLWILTAGDLNNDGKDDLAILGTKNTYLAYQQADGKIATPVPLMNTSNKLGLLQIADLDGDGRNDLCYMANDGDVDRSVCARLQRKDGRLGPELRFELNKPRGLSLSDLDGKPGHEILAVDSKTGRITLQRLVRPQASPGELAGQLIQYGFGEKGTGRERGLATGDLDGDGLTDVVVTDPEAAQMIVFRQHANVGLDLGTTFPGLVGASNIRMVDLDGDKRDEVIVLSSKEKTIGISQLKDGRLTFPKSVPITKEPKALEVADLNGDKKFEIVYVARERVGRSSKYELRALQRDDQGNWQPYKFGDQEALALKLSGTPDRMLQLDANNDQRPDFLVFQGTDRTPDLLISNDKRIPEIVKTEGGIQFGDVAAGGVFVGQLDEPAILVAQEKFVRNLRLDPKGAWQVLDQYNAAESNAKIAGAATLNLDNVKGNEIVLVDSGVGRLRVLRRDGSVYVPWREVEIGAFPFKATHVADLNGDGKDDLLLFGAKQFGVLYTGQSDPKLKQIASFETALERTFFSDVIAGDVNDDGTSDLLIIDTRSHFIELLKFQPSTKERAADLKHALHFKVFEEKSFSSTDERGGSEPRESLIADVTGDGLADLILLIHDRVLLYPQDDGR